MLEKGILNESNKNSNWKKNLLLFTILIFILFIAIVILAVDLRSTNDQYDALMAEHKSLAINYRALTTNHEKLVKECADFRQQMLGSSTNIEAIVSYITTNYRKVPKEVAESIAKNLVTLCAKYNIPYEMAMGIIEVESSFNPSAVSKKDARGLMQVLPSFWLDKIVVDGLNKDKYDLHQIRVGIEAGLAVLQIILNEQDGDMSKALYQYVGKDRSYVLKVHECMGKFILHKSLMWQSQRIKYMEEEIESAEPIEKEVFPNENENKPVQQSDEKEENKTEA